MSYVGDFLESGAGLFGSQARDLYLSLDDYRDAKRLSWQQVTETTGVTSRNIFLDLANGKLPNLSDSQKLYRWLDA